MILLVRPVRQRLLNLVGHLLGCLVRRTWRKRHNCPMGETGSGAVVRAPFADVIAPLIGRVAWGIQQGEGTSLTFEFGRPHVTEGTLARRGDWHLWIYRTAWRIEDARSVLAACGDSREVISVALARLEGRQLMSLETGKPSFDAVFGFDGVALRTFDVWSTAVEKGNESWELFTPADRALVVGPGRRWSYRPNPLPR